MKKDLTKLFFIGIFIYLTSLYLINTDKLFNNLNTLKVKGKVIVISSNQLPGISTKKRLSNEIQKMDIIAVKDKVKNINNSPFINLEHISNSYTITQTDNYGNFSFDLIPGYYSFFVSVGDQLYLNEFNGKGYYKSIKIKKSIDNLILKENSKAIY